MPVLACEHAAGATWALGGDVSWCSDCGAIRSGSVWHRGGVRAASGASRPAPPSIVARRRFVIEPTQVLHWAVTPFRAQCAADVPNQATTQDPANANCPACLRLAVVELRAGREEIDAFARRAVGVISDVERTRGEAAAVLDRYAELWAPRV